MSSRSGWLNEFNSMIKFNVFKITMQAGSIVSRLIENCEKSVIMQVIVGAKIGNTISQLSDITNGRWTSLLQNWALYNNNFMIFLHSFST